MAGHYPTRHTDIIAPHEQQRRLHIQRPDPESMRHESIIGGGRESRRRFESLRAYPKPMRAKSSTGGFRFSTSRCHGYSVRRASSNNWFKSLASLAGTG
ncbi:MAG: hypothetical protein ACK8QZ_05295 [Anaerolineales bacterium]